METGAAVSRAREPESISPRENASAEIRRRFFAFFLVSGFCGILYEVIWMRLSMAQFGVTTAMTSIVISVFMAGLGAGSWAAGKLTRRWEEGGRFPRMHAYALTELVIGIGSLAVPYELLAGRKLLEAAGVSSSAGYYVTAGLWVGAALVPWCTAMGATFPIAMWAMREWGGEDRGRSFSYLYVANVLGALGGTTLPLLLIEALGFRGTLRVGGILNLGLAVWAFVLGRQFGRAPKQGAVADPPGVQVTAPQGSALNLVLLFSAGFTSMGMEVVWIRLYTPYLGTVVYTFAGILATYLIATFLGSLWYRCQGSGVRVYSAMLWAVLGAAALLPLAAADPRIGGVLWLRVVVRLAVGIVPFTSLLGFLTPMLVDRVSGGDPRRAGAAYALNVAGCILGPLAAGFVLLPLAGERWALGVLAAVWIVAGAYFAFRPSAPEQPVPPRGRQLAFAASLAACAALLGVTHDYASQFSDNDKMVRRDATATVIATHLGESKLLLVNGVTMTEITPITKFMAHFPMALLERPPQHVLGICFGMGTTYRSMLSWGVRTDAAELAPSVPEVFSFFHADAPQLLRSPLGRVYVDDGRRHLERTQEMYDVIAIDPPPPISAAGSSLLYSKEFYETAKRRLQPGGIVAQWVPSGDWADLVAVTRAIRESFAHVRLFVAVEGHGLHLLASDAPIPNRSAQELAARLPARAQADLVEWGPYRTPEAQFAALLKNEVAVEDVLRLAPSVAAMTDDRPVNEYCLLRELLH